MGEDQVCFLIEDDGKGFVVDRVDKQDRQRYGLQIMRERAESVGGMLSLDSQPGKGTSVKVSLPLGDIDRR
jgi:signal transduction histidine kinase